VCRSFYLEERRHVHRDVHRDIKLCGHAFNRGRWPGIKVTWNWRQPAVKSFDLLQSLYLEPGGGKGLGREGKMLINSVKDFNKDGW